MVVASCMVFKTLGGESFSFFFKKKQSPNIWIDTELKLPGKQSHLLIILIVILLEKKDAYSKGNKAGDMQKDIYNHWNKAAKKH